VLWKNLDEIGREDADHTPVASQSPGPPRSVASIETFYQVAFDEAEVLFGLPAPGVDRAAPARKTRWQR
jgi:hypothetical protein